MHLNSHPNQMQFRLFPFLLRSVISVFSVVNCLSGSLPLSAISAVNGLSQKHQARTLSRPGPLEGGQSRGIPASGVV